MTYSVGIPVDGLTFTIIEPTIDELLDAYEQAGGDAKWLLSRVQESVPEIEGGQAPPTAPPTATRGRQSAASDPGPWGEDPGSWDDRGSRGSERPAQRRTREDPWDGAAVEDKPARRRSAPSRGNSGRRSQPAELNEAGAETLPPDRFGRIFTVGLPDAPLCECGEPAARMKATSQAGNKYTQFVCAKEAPGGDYRDKCKFKEFPPR